MKLSQFKHYIPKANLYIEECKDVISISGETYSEIVDHASPLWWLPLSLCYKIFIIRVLEFNGYLFVSISYPPPLPLTIS